MTRYGLMLVLLCSLLVVSCGGSSSIPPTAAVPPATAAEATAVPPTEPAPTPTQPAPTAVPTLAPTSSSSGTTTKVDLDKIFPPGPGKDLVMRDCTTCHTFVPLVILQMDRPMWERNGRDHRARAIGATDEEFNTLYEYLIENFGPDDPVPELPAQLLATWTSY